MIKDKNILLDAAIILIGLSLFFFIRGDYVIMFLYIYCFPYLFLTKRKKLVYALLISSLLSFFWVSVVGSNYSYNKDFIIFEGINLFIFFVWAVSLFSIVLVNSHIPFFKSKFRYRVLKFSVLYWILLITIETLFYHVYEIRDVATGMYPGLPLCNCMHMPIWMMIGYFLMGPLYFFLCKFYKVFD